MASVKVWLDRNFIQVKGSGEVLSCLQNQNTVTIIEALPVENSIFWTRNSSSESSKSTQSAAEEVQHDHILVILEVQHFFEMINDFIAKFSDDEDSDESSLIKFIHNIKAKAQVTQITFVINNLKQNIKSLQTAKPDSKTKENDFVKKTSKSKNSNPKKNLTKSDLNVATIHMELNENTCVRSYETIEELKNLVLSYTKAVDEYLNKQSSGEEIIFCDKSSDKSQNKIGKDGQGLINLWKDMIECFPMVSNDQAQAICAVYPSPLLLKKAYESASNSNSAAMLLADIQVRRGAGVLTSVRKIGPELSQKIYKFFNSTNINELLVNN